jgi:hypothetical protein
MAEKHDKRRWGVIEVSFRPKPVPTYSLKIGGELWAAVEWSATRRTWCIEDAAGHCLAHCEHIHGGNIDRPTAIAMAKHMIVDGTIPTPEEADRQLEAEQAERRRSAAKATKAAKPKAGKSGMAKAGPAKPKRLSETAVAEAKRLEEAAADGMRQLEAMRQRDAVPLPAESSTASRQSTKN